MSLLAVWVVVVRVDFDDEDVLLIAAAGLDSSYPDTPATRVAIMNIVAIMMASLVFLGFSGMGNVVISSSCL